MASLTEPVHVIPPTRPFVRRREPGVFAAGCGPAAGTLPLWTDAGAPYRRDDSTSMRPRSSCWARRSSSRRPRRLRPERRAARGRSGGAARARARRQPRRLESDSAPPPRRPPTPPQWSITGLEPGRRYAYEISRRRRRRVRSLALCRQRHHRAPARHHVHVRRDGRQPHRAARSDPGGLDRRPGALLRTWRARCARWPPTSPPPSPTSS